jgi:hypothetical protein
MTKVVVHHQQLTCNADATTAWPHMFAFNNFQAPTQAVASPAPVLTLAQLLAGGNGGPDASSGVSTRHCADLIAIQSTLQNCTRACAACKPCWLCAPSHLDA